MVSNALRKTRTHLGPSSSVDANSHFALYYCPPDGRREGTGDVATSDVVLFYLGRPRTHRPRSNTALFPGPRTAQVMPPFLILSVSIGDPENAKVKLQYPLGSGP